jgi:release factor glutamine methyltransferase
METHNVFYHIQHISTRLSAEYIDPTLCQQYAWWLLEAVLKTTKMTLITQNTILLTPAQEQTLEQWITELVTHKKPIQYILGSVPFNGLDILVEPPTLIPRPETEEWCAKLIEKLKALDNQNITILDLATGSGCIGLSLAYHLPHAHIIASDIADTALALAEKNKLHNNIQNMTLIKSDLFDSLPPSTKYDLIVSNPPYIAQSDREHMEKSVTEWEDERALFAPDNGLSIIKKIITQSPAHTKPNTEIKQKNIPQVMIEIGHKQGSLVAQLMIDAGYNAVHIYTDLEKKERVVVGRIDYVATTTTG